MTTKHKVMRVALHEAVEAARDQIQGGIPDPVIRDAVRDLCEQHGYGNVMATASMLWREKDPLGAFVCGPCVGTVEHFLKLARNPEAQ